MFSENTALVKKKCFSYGCFMTITGKKDGFTTVMLGMYDPDRYLEVYGKIYRISYKNRDCELYVTADKQRYGNMFTGTDFVMLDLTVPDEHKFVAMIEYGSENLKNCVADLIFEDKHIYEFKLEII